jgi:hypothetical protein
MAFKIVFNIVRKAKTTPYFRAWLATQPTSPQKTAFAALVEARAAEGITATTTFANDGLSQVFVTDYGTQKIYDDFEAKYATEIALVKEARIAYEATAGITRSFSIEE